MSVRPRRRLSTPASFESRVASLEPNHEKRSRRSTGVASGSTPKSNAKVQESSSNVSESLVSNIIGNRDFGSHDKSLSNEQLANLYANCIRLSTENKITQKNSWQLNLIDHMEDVLEHQELSGDNPNFQAASCTLDASVKIYSCRVDSVHTEAYKVLGDLSRTEREVGDQVEVEIGEEQAEMDPSTQTLVRVPKKKKPRKLSGTGCTLSLTNDALNARQLDLEFLIDPLFRLTSAAFDEGGAKGLLLNHLSVQHGCELVFDSADALGAVVDSVTADSVCDVTDLYGIYRPCRRMTGSGRKEVNKQENSEAREFPKGDADLLAAGGDLLDIERLEICPTYSDFAFDQGEPTTEASASESNYDYGVVSGDESSVVFDEENPPLPVVARESDTRLSDVEVSKYLGDFHLFDPVFPKRENGADHWQYVAKSNGTQSEVDVKKKEKKSKKEFVIDFRVPPPPQSKFALAEQSPITLSECDLSKFSEKSTMLPGIPEYCLDDLTRLFSKPKWRITLDGGYLKRPKFPWEAETPPLAAEVEDEEGRAMVVFHSDRDDDVDDGGDGDNMQSVPNEGVFGVWQGVTMGGGKKREQPEQEPLGYFMVIATTMPTMPTMPTSNQLRVNVYLNLREGKWAGGICESLSGGKKREQRAKEP